MVFHLLGLFSEVKSQRCKEIRRYSKLLLLTSPLSCAEQAAAFGFASLLLQGAQEEEEISFSRCFLLPHAIMEPEGWFFLYLEDLVWCIPELFVLIIQGKEVVAQRGHSCHKNTQMDESQGSSAHPHPKTQMHKANIGSWRETDTGISLKQTLGRKGWGGAVTLVQLFGFRVYQTDHSGVKVILKPWFCQRSELERKWLKTFILSRSQKWEFYQTHPFILSINLTPRGERGDFSKQAESFGHSPEGFPAKNTLWYERADLL